MRLYTRYHSNIRTNRANSLPTKWRKCVWRGNLYTYIYHLLFSYTCTYTLEYVTMAAVKWIQITDKSRHPTHKLSSSGWPLLSSEANIKDSLCPSRFQLPCDFILKVFNIFRRKIRAVCGNKIFTPLKKNFFLLGSSVNTKAKTQETRPPSSWVWKQRLVLC